MKTIFAALILCTLTTQTYAQGVGALFENYEDATTSTIDYLDLGLGVKVQASDYYVQCYLNYDNFAGSAMCNAKSSTSDGQIHLRNSFSFDCYRTDTELGIECELRSVAH